MLLSRSDHLEIFRPKCDPSKEVLHALASFGEDISPALPYLNADLGGWDYDPQNHVLLLKLSAGKWITFQPHQLAIRGCRDQEEARALANWAQAQINDIYAPREQFTPRYTGQAGLKVMEIMKCLPLTNCKVCGYATCMAFAAALREGEASPDCCAPLGEEKCREEREKLHQYLKRYGWRARDEG
jgi:ArsR family metal-binding transcriptional regulator